MTANSLVFQSTQFSVVDRSGQPWLKLPEIAESLYSRKGGDQSDAPFENGIRQVKKLYARNADEFTGAMTTLVELDTAGGKQHVRIFSLRGAHLLGMFARTAKAKEFRKWVLDILEGVTAPPEPVKPCLPPPRYLTKTQDSAVMALMKSKLKHLPWKQQLPAAGDFMSAIKAEFGAPLGQIGRNQFFALLAYVTAYEVVKINEGHSSRTSI